jgi:hypothetical protein
MNVIKPGNLLCGVRRILGSSSQATIMSDNQSLIDFWPLRCDHVSLLNTETFKGTCSWRRFLVRKGMDIGWIISVSVELFITAKPCECWNDVCVICGESLSFKVCKTQYAVSHITSQLYTNSDFFLTRPSIRMGSSKVQHGLDFSTINIYCEWKNQN